MFGQQVISYFVVAGLSPAAVVVLCEAGSQARAGSLCCATMFLVVKFLAHGSTCRGEGVGGPRARHGVALVFINEIKLSLFEQINCLCPSKMLLLHFAHRGQANQECA